MGIWVRGCSRSATILNQYRRRHNWPFSVSVPISLLHGRKFPQQEGGVLQFSHSHSDAAFFFTRGYAVLTKAKKEEGNKVEVKHAADDPEGPRINSAITSDPVRLVTDKGHQIVSRREALDYAKKLKFDLVEVQRHAKPPVCKVMDYNKEKYKQQQREKDRTKNKLDLTVRKGECREVRFTAKTEQKDLERKAEMAKRLMDRGYRVKCMAMGQEGQNLEELLLRLSTLIEDVSFVESGPKAEKRNAWMIVRHTKFGGTKKKGAQQTPKAVERTEGETVKDNLKKTVESESKKEDGVVSPKEQSKEELVQFEEFASSEFGEHEPELAPFEESVSFEKFGDNEVKFTPAEESPCFEQFGEHETELVPSIEKVEEAFTANVHFTNKIKMTATESVKQEEFMAVDVHNDIETRPEPRDLNADISINQRMQNLAATDDIMQSRLASNTGKSPKQVNFPIKMKGEDASIVYSVDAPLGNFNSPASEIGSHVRPLSSKLNFGLVKPEQFETSDFKKVASVHDLRQAVVGRSQGHSASNIGKLASIDSVPKWASGSFKANVEDVPSNCPSNISVPCEEASNIGEQLQNSHVNLNNDPAMQDHQEMPIASSISGDVSRHVLSHSFGDQGTNTSKDGKQSSVDSVPKQIHVSGGTRWGIFGQAKSSAQTETEIGVPNGKHSGPSDYSKQVLAGARSSQLGISASNKGNQKPLDLIPKKANDSEVFISANSKEVSPLSGQASNNAMSRDPSRISISKNPVSGDGGPSEQSRQVLAGIGSSALRYSASNKAKQKPLDWTPNQLNDSGVSISGNYKEVPPLSVQESNNSVSRDPSRTPDSKNPVPGDDKSQSPADSSPSSKGNHASVVGKQASTSAGSRWGIFSAPRSAVVESPRQPTGVTGDHTKKVSAPRSAVVESPSHPAGVTVDQTKKDQPYSSEKQNINVFGKVGSGVEPSNLHPQNQRHVPIDNVGTTKQVAKQALRETPDSKKDQPYGSEGQNFGASIKGGSNADPRHLPPQNQRHVPVGSVGTANQVAKQAPKETPAEVVDKPEQTRWGIFSMRSPSKPADGTEKPEG